MTSNEYNHSLSREAAFSTIAIGTGLTHVRRYDFVNHWFFYNGIYMITIGLERLLKLIIIYDYRIKNQGAFPTNALLKAKGHRLEKLIECARAINNENACGIQDSNINSDELVTDIIKFLDNYAMRSRYYNLDRITGILQEGDEPLKYWNDSICNEIVKRHYRHNKHKETALTALGTKLDSFACFRFMSESGGEVNSGVDFLLKGMSVSIKQKYSVYYIYCVLNFLVELFTALEYKGCFYPCLREYYKLYLQDEKQWILSKKSWYPMAPYHF